MGGQSAPSFVLSISLLLLLLLVSVLEPSQSLAVDQAVNGWYKPVNTRDSARGSAALGPRLNVNPRAIITTSTSTSAPTTIEENDHVDAINPRALVFPSEDGKMPNRIRLQPDEKMPQQIPLDFINKLNDANDWTTFLDLVENVTVDQGEDSSDHASYGDWDDVVARTAARDPGVTVAKQASCQPEIQTVKLVQSDDPSVIYLPSCTRIERCGGCCNSELLECQPTKEGEETVMLQVVKMQYNSGKLKPSGKQIIPVQKHTKCACQCKVKETDCIKEIQEYNKGACRCECSNVDDRRKCEADNQTRFWDSGSCKCRCRLSGEANALGQCSTGFYFDEETCKCDAQGVNRHSDINGLRAIIGEGGRRPTVNAPDAEFAHPRPWFNDNKNDDDNDREDEEKDTPPIREPVSNFKFPGLASRQG